MRRLFFLVFLAIFSCQEDNEVDIYFGESLMPESENIFTQPYIKQVAQAVCNWQINHPVEMPEDNNWARSTFLLGIISAFKITQDDDYLKYCLNWANRNKWKLSKHSHPADNLLCAKAYLELIELSGSLTNINAIQQEIIRIRNANTQGHEEWYWSDALFMAPPAIIHFHNLIDPRSNYDLFYEMWWDAHTYLYSSQDSLYYRDDRFINTRTFWLRGNGWVIAGIAKILEQLPTEHPEYVKLSKVFNEIAEKLKSIQNPEGLWYPSLLQGDKYPFSETSGSALICYALAWGVNNGVLEKEDYYHCIEKAWQGILSKIHPNGKVGWVQPRGDRPGKVSADDFQEYGAGAVLLAAYEIYKFIE